MSVIMPCMNRFRPGQSPSFLGPIDRLTTLINGSSM